MLFCRLNPRSRQLKQIRSLRKCEQLKVLHEIKNNSSTMLKHVILVFAQLNDNNINSAIKQICESREINTRIQRKRNNYIIIQICNLLDQQVLNASTLFQTMTYPRGIHKGEIVFTYLQKKALKPSRLPDYIYELFGEELADAKHELNTTDFENFCELLHDDVENALNGLIKWMETWVHLPLCICRLGGENGPEFARAFLK
ncbi:18170_t:CDS:2, partial [Gigaspora margarita]